MTLNTYERERLGKAVRAAWVARKVERLPNCPEQFQTWEDLTDFERETDRCIADAVLSDFMAISEKVIEAGRKTMQPEDT